MTIDCLFRYYKHGLSSHSLRFMLSSYRELSNCLRIARNNVLVYKDLDLHFNVDVSIVDGSRSVLLCGAL